MRGQSTGEAWVVYREELFGGRPGPAGLPAWAGPARPACRPKLDFPMKSLENQLFPGDFRENTFSLALLLVSQTKFASGFVRSCFVQRFPFKSILFLTLRTNVFW